VYWIQTQTDCSVFANFHSHSLLEDKPIEVTATSFAEPGLLTVCKALRNEATTTNYEEDRFHTVVCDWDSDVLLLWTAEHRALQREQHRNTNTGWIGKRPPIANWRNLELWLRQVNTTEVTVTYPTPSALVPAKPTLAESLVACSRSQDQPWLG